MNRRKISAMLAVALITSQVQTITFAETNNQDLINEIVSENTDSQNSNEEVNKQDQDEVISSDILNTEENSTENNEIVDSVNDTTSSEDSNKEDASNEDTTLEDNSNNQEVTNTEESVKVEDTSDKQETLSETNKEYKVTGKLEVDLNFANPIKLKGSSETNIEITLKNSQGIEVGSVSLGNDVKEGFIGEANYTLEALDSMRKPLEENAEQLGFYHLTIDKLPVGTYSIEITGSGYASTTVNNIEIQNKSKRVLVGTAENVIETVEGTEKYPGNFLVGDVDGSGKVDKADYDELKSKIGSNDSKYDLNRDGNVDITDLTYIHENLDKAKVDVLIEDTDVILNPENVEISADATTEVNGDIKDILVDTNSSVTLKKAEKITKDNAIEIPIVLDSKTRSQNAIEEIVIKSPSADTAPSSLELVDEEGKILGSFSSSDEQTSVSRARSTEDGTIKINLGQQVAVSKITIKITGGSKKNTNLAEIAKVEFLNNVYKEMPKPKMNIPVINNFTSTTQVGQESMTIGWDHETNVTGYEIEVTNLGNGQKLTYKTSKNSLRIEKVEAYGVYRIRIQSLSGEWKSGYKDEQEGYNDAPQGNTNLTNNTNDKDGAPDNVDGDFNPQAWDSVSGKLGDGDANFGKDSIIEVQVIPETAPEGPEGIKVDGGYKQLTVSWKAHAKAKDYELYYRKVGTKEWLKANDKGTKYVDTDITNEIPDGAANLKPGVADKEDFIRKNSYTITGLDDTTSYEIMMTATNHHGTGGLSQVYMGETTSLKPPTTINYKLINTPNGVDELTNHIVGVEMPTGNEYAQAHATDADAIVDNDYTTYWEHMDWDYGAGGPIITFDKEYNIGSLKVIRRLDVNELTNWTRIDYYNEETGKWEEVKTSFYESNEGKVVNISLAHPIKTKKIKVGVTVYASVPWGDYRRATSISEIKFYEYDSLESDVDNLFADDLRLSLKENVDQKLVDELITRANTEDPINKEYHPNKDEILKNLQRAQDLLNDKALNDEIITLDSTIHNVGKQNTIGQSNNYQALGVAVKPGDKVNIYIGSPDRKDTKFDLVLTQFNAESGTAYKVIKELSIGKNEIEIPKTGFDMNYEKGGNLYIGLKSGFAENNTFKVRVSGGVEIPHLNVNNIIDDTTKVSDVKDKIRTYITELETYVNEVANKYPEKATSEDNSKNIYTYDPQTSILNATDIEGERIMLSLAADQVLAGIQSGLEGNLEGQVDRLYNTLLAWEQLMKISYTQQGLLEKPIDLNNNGTIDSDETSYYNANRAPKNRMNIKYQRMFTGAFMYASSHHVGIGYGSIADTMKGVPFKFDENGNLTNANEGQLFGWGIAHEIGHVHDVSGLTYLETTNNILALITQTFNDISASRIEGNYTSVYDKVTSNSVGLASDKTTLLGMFWQLHLAYDNDYTYKMLDLNTDNNLDNDTFFAKLYRMTRTKGIAVSESGQDRTAQTFIMRASDAVGKDLRGFFEKWGLVASPETNIYLNAKAYPKEDKAIYYLNDEARRLRLAAGNDTSKLTMATDTKVIASFGEGIEDRSYLNKKEVPLTLSVDKDSNKILGYEIIRKEATDSGTKEVVVGFVERDKNGENGLTNYVDEIDAVNNRAFEYKVRAYDYNLNVTSETSIGTVKVNHDGSIAKGNWVFDTNTRSSEDVADENSGHGQVQNGSIKKINDNNPSTIYTASKATNNSGTISKEDPYVTIDLGDSKSVIGLKYNPGQETKKFSLKNFFSRSSETEYSPITNYEVYVSEDGNTWSKAHSGTFDTNKENTIYFNETGSSLNTQLWAYEAQYVKLVAKGASAISIAELDILGPVGDNIEIGSDNGNKVYENGIGKLKEEYQFADGQSIPKGSIIVTGEYTGDPAFNVPLVLNEDDENLSDIANVLLFAEIPENSELGAVAKGTWLYYITPEEQAEAKITGSKIKAQLYRYNKLGDNKEPIGQRLVSDTFYYDFDITKLPEIELSSSKARTLSITSNEVIKIDNDMIKTVFNNRK